MSNSEDSDNIQIGSRRRGMILVCHGDDCPDQFEDWLEPLVNEFNRLSSIASDHDVNLLLPNNAHPVTSVMDFCELLGIEFSSNMWEGSMISGIYRVGWIKVGTVRSASALGRKLIRAFEKQTETAVRSAVMHELQGIKDLDEFIDRTTDDRGGLHRKISSLSSSLLAAKSALDSAEEKAKKAAENDSTKIDRACVALSAALLAGEKCRLVAGPLVLWDDGVLYAICSWGRTSIPEGSSPSVLLNGVEKSGRRVVRVSDRTTLGAWTSGPIYFNGPVNISGWDNAWGVRTKKERTFAVNPPEFAAQVQHIHEVLASDQQ